MGLATGPCGLTVVPVRAQAADMARISTAPAEAIRLQKECDIRAIQPHHPQTNPARCRPYRLVVPGKGSPGFVMGEATVELVDADGATLVKVTGQGQVGGLMARVGQRLLSSASKMMMDRFFGCLQAKATQVTPPVG